MNETQWRLRGRAGSAMVSHAGAAMTPKMGCSRHPRSTPQGGIKAVLFDAARWIQNLALSLLYHLKTRCSNNFKQFSVTDSGCLPKTYPSSQGQQNRQKQTFINVRCTFSADQLTVNYFDTKLHQSFIIKFSCILAIFLVNHNIV